MLRIIIIDTLSQFELNLIWSCSDWIPNIVRIGQKGTSERVILKEESEIMWINKKENCKLDNRIKECDGNDNSVWRVGCF